MPVVPDISLGVNPPAQAQNPLGIVSSFADVQNKLNKNRLFQMQIQAKQRFGEIVAAAPDMETGLQQAAKDPVAAPFAGEAIASYRASMLANQQLQNEQQSGSMTGYKAVLSAIPGAMDNPSLLGPSIDAQLKTLSPTARSRVEPAISSLVTSLTGNLPSDLPSAKAEFQKRLAALSIGSGVITPEGVQGILGKPTEQNLGGTIMPGTQAPAQGTSQAAPGAFTPQGNPLTMGAAPSVETTPGGGLLTKPGLPGGVQTGPQPSAAPNVPNFGQQPGTAPQGNALGVAPPPVSAANAPMPANSPSSAPSGAPLSPSTQISPAIPAAPVVVQKDSRGMPILGLLDVKANSDALSIFNGEGANQFRLSQQGLSKTAEMDTDLDTLARAGGMHTPGTFGQIGNSFAKAVNSFEQMTGNKLDFDPKAVSSFEQLNKDTRTMALSVLNQFLGGQREAASTIQGITQAVPSIDNTYLGAKLVNASTRAMFQRSIDERNFVNDWRQKNGGAIVGAAEEFNRIAPPEAYAQHVLDQFGMTTSRAGAQFKDLPSVVAAQKAGLLTRDDARAIAKEQFGYTGGAPAAPPSAP